MTLIQYLFFPDDAEIIHFHVDYHHAPLTVLLSMISLSGGATLGPEQALVSRPHLRHFYHRDYGLGDRYFS